jgi:F-type H+-transporting ATPase subunit gamma
MISTRDIRRKIRAVRNIQQICRAMKTVSLVKLRRAEARLYRARPYREALRRLAGRLAALLPEHRLLASREVKRSGLVVIGSDKGLAGGYNVNLLRFASSELDKRAGAAVLPLGRRAVDFFRRRGVELLGRLAPLGTEPDLAQLAPVAEQLLGLYRDGGLDEVLLVYTRFLTRGQSEVQVERLLPIVPESSGGEWEWLFEPAPERLLEELLPRFMRNALFVAALEASASEHAARVIAMTAASDNAEELVRDLTLHYNRARQAAITRELIEIAGAAEALK